MVGITPASARTHDPRSDGLPTLGRPAFQEDGSFADPLGLTRAVIAALRMRRGSGSRPVAYVDTWDPPAAYRLVGRYRTDGVLVTVRFRLVLPGGRDTIPAGDAADVVTGREDDLPALAARLLGRMEGRFST